MCLNKGINGVRVVREDMNLKKSVPTIRAEPAHRVLHRQSGKRLNHSTSEHLKTLLNPRELFNLSRSSITDGNIGSSFEDRTNEIRDVPRGILIITIGIHHDVGALLQRVIDSRSKRAPEPSTINATRRYDVVNSEGTRHLNGIVRRAVINNLILNDIDARYMSRHPLKHEG